MDDEQKTATPPATAEIECPKCHHKFLHKIETALKDGAEALGNAIGEAKFGE